ncbi:ricin-type beta-trefoil lectin domain protein [Streptomyces beigongshangae]|uniref:ricin-type beta-trefoil lectin domain protein n=1 Tax=Streptomyces beigongshangae TaxID=2841597 RepID=UPI001C865A33|nr:ricin-type beta-trefoil lectin domain protein [Streptomyces sp. REN17]
MSDQQQASGESPVPGAAAPTPGAEAVAARPAGAEKPRTASAPKDTGTDSTGTGTGTGTADEADGSGEAPDGERAGEKADEKADENEKAGKDAKGAGENPGGEGATDDKGGARALSAAAAGEHHRAVATAAAGKGATGATVSAVGRPRKPVLAGAALAGAVLVAVPLLITVAGRDEERKTVDSTAADTVLNEVDGPAGVFATQSPSPSKSAPGKEKKKAQSAAPPAEKAAAAPSAEPSPSPSRKKKAKAEEEEKDEEKAAVAKKATNTLPAVLTRVLIKNNTNHTCVDVPGFTSGRQDGPVTHATCNSNTDDNQLWNVEQRYPAAGPGGVPLFQIRNVMDGMCLDLPGYQGVGGATKVTEFPCDGSTNDNQLWWLDKQSDGKFWIRNAASNNQCLDSYGVDDRTRDLIVWLCAPEGRNNHEWIFTRS